MTTERLYDDRAGLYDLVYQWKDHAGEAERLHELIAAEGIADGARLLDAACGTGSHLAALSRWYDVSGFDRGAGMVEAARGKLPDARIVQADLETFSVDAPFDVATCLFSSIGYLLDEAALARSAARFAAAVRPGGLLIVEPWFQTEDWDLGRPHANAANSPDISIVRITRAEREADVSVNRMLYLVARRDAAKYERFEDEHRLWLCPHDTLVRVFDAAGFDATLRDDGLMEGRGLLVGRRRG